MRLRAWKLIVGVGVALVVYWWAISSGVTDEPVLFAIVGGAATVVGLLPDP